MTDAKHSAKHSEFEEIEDITPYKGNVLLPKNMQAKKISNYKFESLDKYVNEDRKENPYFHSYKFSTCFVGGSSSGKTTTMINMFDQKIYNPDLVIYCAPSETLNSGLVNSFIKRRKAIAVELNQELDFNDLYKQFQIIHKKKPSLTKIIIFDDFQSFVRNKEFNKMLNTLLSNASRYNANMILLCQTLTNIDTKISSNINVWALFCRYLPESQIKVVLKNRSNVDLSNEDMAKLITTLRRAKNPHIPLIVNSLAPLEYQLIYENYALTI